MNTLMIKFIVLPVNLLFRKLIDFLRHDSKTLTTAPLTLLLSLPFKGREKRRGINRSPKEYFLKVSA